jgi:hypothetical protein
MLFKAHANSETLPGQLLSAVAIDPVASSMMAMFHVRLYGPGATLGGVVTLPPMEAIAVVVMLTLGIPNSSMKYVGTLAVCETLTALQVSYRQAGLALAL